MMAARSVSLVEKQELEFQGTIYRNAIAFGDVDQDGGNELVVCNTSGQLFVYKGKSPKPWRMCMELGCVTAVVIDDVKNDGIDCVLCLNTEGHCFIFDQMTKTIHDELKTEKMDNEKIQPTKGAKSSPAHSHDIAIKYSSKQNLPANPKMALVADIDGDGQNELIICYTDRYVRVFRFKTTQTVQERKLTKSEETQESSASSKRNEFKQSRQSSKDDDAKSVSSMLVKQPSKDSEGKTPSPRSPKPDAKTNEAQRQAFTYQSHTEGEFKQLQEFYLPGQIGSIAVTLNSNGQTQLIASQPAGGYAVLAVYAGEDGKDATNEDNRAKRTNNGAEQPCVYYPHAGFPHRNLNVNSEVIGSIHRNHEISGLFCLTTVDGYFALIDASTEGISVLPGSRTTEHQWFRMDTMDIDDRGNDAIALCSWEGMTYVLDKNLELINYNFGENICGFSAGQYAMDSQHNAPCFCYVTFSNRIVLFYDVSCIGQKSASVCDALIEKLKARPEFDHVLRSLMGKDGKVDRIQLKELVKSKLSNPR